MSNCMRCSVKDSMTQFQTSKYDEIYSPNMQYTTSRLLMNIIGSRLGGFQELFFSLFAAILSALVLKKSRGCPQLWATLFCRTGLGGFFSLPKRAFLTIISGFGRKDVMEILLLQATAWRMRVRGSKREREKDTHMMLKYEIEKSTPRVLYWLKN